MSRFARFNLFVAFAFTVMADPVSSIAYAIEAALGALDGDLASLLPTMALVVASVALVAATYHQLIGRFPRGAGGAEGVAAAFGEGWAFVPVGALLVDFTLTIAISSAAAASAVIAYLPELADLRVPLALALAAAVAGGSMLGHLGRVVFATATLAFGAVALAVLTRGALTPPADAAPALAGDAALGAMLLAMPLGMALATGVEAPSDAVAQLDELEDAERRRFGRATIWLMLAIVGGLTLAVATLAVRLGVGAPDENSTLLADVARESTGGDAMFPVFQAVSALLLLAAAASSYLAGSGLLKALAEHGGAGNGLIPGAFGRVNRWHSPPWGLMLLLGAAALLVVLAGGRDQEIVHFYAAAVFMSFLAAIVACARLTWRERAWPALAVNLAGGVVVGFVLALNLARVDPLAAIGASTLVSVYLWRAWVRRGRPSGISHSAAG